MRSKEQGARCEEQEGAFNTFQKHRATHLGVYRLLQKEFFNELFCVVFYFIAITKADVIADVIAVIGPCTGVLPFVFLTVYSSLGVTLVHFAADAVPLSLQIACK